MAEVAQRDTSRNHGRPHLRHAEDDVALRRHQPLASARLVVVAVVGVGEDERLLGAGVGEGRSHDRDVAGAQRVDDRGHGVAGRNGDDERDLAARS